ncbi:hypothetical protein KAT82_00485 [bacterium]|nr:hypothetical protein [bacterium]
MSFREFSRRLLVPLALLTASVVLTLAVVEVGLRLVAPSENIANVEYEPLRGWRGAVNARFTFEDDPVRMEVVHNSRGYRDLERTGESPDGAERILCCGDSFTWGWGVEQDSIYTRVLEDACREERRLVEVINMGICGQGTAQAFIGLRDHGFDYRPAVVVYQAADNDIPGNLRPGGRGMWRKPYFVLEDDGALVLHDCPVPPLSFKEQVKYQTVRRSRLAHLLRSRVRAYLSQRAWRERAERPRGPARAVDYRFRLFCALVNLMNEECAEHSAHLVVLMDFSLSGERMEYWEEQCGEVDAHFIFDYLVRQQKVRGTPAFIPGDGHWTTAAHRWIADYLRDVVPRDMQAAGETAADRGHATGRGT